MTKQQLVRGAARRLAIIRHAREVTGNVAGTCRYYGITPPGLLHVAPPLRGGGPFVLDAGPKPVCMMDGKVRSCGRF
jgi:hypothetical protein